MAMDLIGQRWILRTIWELQPGTLRFLELRARMDNCSSSVLSERLRQLSAAGLVVKTKTGAWELTALGAELGSALTSVWDWAERWDGERRRPAEAASLRPTAVQYDERRVAPAYACTPVPPSKHVHPINPNTNNPDHAIS